MVRVLKSLSMDDIVISRRKCENTENRHLRKMVRSLVTNLESFQNDLLIVLDDMKDLVGQIDKVSSKLDKSLGNQWRDESEVPKPKQVMKTHRSPTDHNYVNIDLRPTIQHIEEKINSKLCSKGQPDVKRTTENFDAVSSLRAVRPNSFEKDLEDTIVKHDDTQKAEQMIDSLESPMLDLSYLGMHHADDRPRWGRSISLPMGVKSHTPSPLLSPDLKSSRALKGNSPLILEEFRTPTAICFAELKRHYVTKDSISSFISDDVFHETDLKTSSPATGTTVKSVTSSSMISNVSIDGDLYERKLDDELENILDTSDDSMIIESSDDSMETASNTRTDTYSDNAEGRCETNTWTSFTFNHMTESTKSSESFVSDTPSDIMNDNIWPSSSVRDIFSNSMLARKFNKNLDNDFTVLNGDVNQ